jgi:hypothetical protein
MHMRACAALLSLPNNDQKKVMSDDLGRLWLVNGAVRRPSPGPNLATDQRVTSALRGGTKVDGASKFYGEG